MIPTLVVGVGNRDRGDDGAGLEVARLLRQSPPSGALVLEQDGSSGDLLDAWRGAKRVIVVDAAFGGEPGTVRRFEAHREAIPARLFRGSTHSWGVEQAIETARALEELPPVVIVYAIFGQCFDVGSRSLSPEVQAAAARLAQALRQEGATPRRLAARMPSHPCP